MARTNQTYTHQVVCTLFAVALLCFCSSAVARIVSEQEPNNGFAQANFIACGDTVLCAQGDVNSGDFYSLLVPGGDSTYFRTFPCEIEMNTVVLLYDSSFNLLGLNNNSGPGYYSDLGVFMTQTQMCYLQVVDPGHTFPGDYTLVVTCHNIEAGPHDLCSSARDVTFFPYYDESSTFGCGNEGGTSSPDVYYRLSLATPGDLYIQVCSESFNARVQVLTGCVTGFMDDSDAGECHLGADLLTFGLQAQTYYIMVEGTSLTQQGDFTIEIRPLLAACPEPTNLSIFDVGGLPFLDWTGDPDADYYLIEQAADGQGPYEAITTTTETFWQDPLGYSLTRRFYRVRSICE